MFITPFTIVSHQLSSSKFFLEQDFMVSLTNLNASHCTFSMASFLKLQEMTHIKTAYSNISLTKKKYMTGKDVLYSWVF